jgi:hypothetical protein
MHLLMIGLTDFMIMKISGLFHIGKRVSIPIGSMTMITSRKVIYLISTLCIEKIQRNHS